MVLLSATPQGRVKSKASCVEPSFTTWLLTLVTH